MAHKVKVAVSGTGGGVGQSIIKALHNTNYEVIALDGDKLATGLYAVSKSYLIPYANDDSYIDSIIKICKAENCRLFFPGLDAELPVLSRSIEKFHQAGIQAIVSSPAVIDLSDDKLLTYNTLKEHDLNAPFTIDMADYLSGKASLPSFPFILKKRIGGARSQGMHLIKSLEELENLASTGIDLSIFVAQEYIEGDEYTCGSINLNGECKGVIVMRRILRDGDTYKCFAVKNKIIEDYVKRIMSFIKPFGACNLQLRLKDGQPYAFEINARCSGTTAARALCGFNEPKMIADYLCSDIVPEYEIKEQTVLRYWKEVIVNNDNIDILSSTGSLSQNDFTSL